MKTLPKTLLSLSIILLLAAGQVSTASADDLPYNPAAEEHILSELLVTGQADLALAFTGES